MNDIWPAFVDFGNLIIPTAVIIGSIIAVVSLIFRIINGKIDRTQISLISAFAVIGGFPGLIAGYSQQAVAGAFLSGLITVVAGLGTYALGKDSLVDFRPAIPFMITATMIAAIGGFSGGTYAKKQWLLYDQQVQDRRDEMQFVVLPVERERQLIQLRRNNSIPVTVAEQ
jgi:hypothetical protein